MLWVVQWEILQRQAGAAADKGSDWPLVVGGEGAAKLQLNHVQRKFQEKRCRCDSGNHLMDSPCFNFIKNNLHFVLLCPCCVESMKRPLCDCVKNTKVLHCCLLSKSGMAQGGQISNSALFTLANLCFRNRYAKTTKRRCTQTDYNTNDYIFNGQHVWSTKALVFPCLLNG